MVVIVDEVLHGMAQLVRAGVDQQVYAGFQRLVEALDFAVGLRMMRRAVDVADCEHTQILLEDPRHVPRAMIAEELRAVFDRHLPHAGDSGKNIKSASTSAIFFVKLIMSICFICGSSTCSRGHGAS